MALVVSNEQMIDTNETNRILLTGMVTALIFAFSPQQIVTTVNEIARKNSTITCDLLDKSNITVNALNTVQTQSLRVENSSISSPLTLRETEVLNLMADGLMNKEIAKKIGLREGTVKCHITSILRKLNVSVRTEAVVFGIKNGFINV
jgi:DNA-binding NarL/FixJ family response regulator